MTSPLESEALEIIRAWSEGDELEMPRLQAYANGLRDEPDNSSLLSAAIELMDEMAQRRMVRLRMVERLRDRGLLDETSSIAIADLAED